MIPKKKEVIEARNRFIICKKTKDFLLNQHKEEKKMPSSWKTIISKSMS